ncbi:MAG: terminase family protein [Novosphingobium sp.]|nr:terminase family protein [Novosphingobium sp.]
MRRSELALIRRDQLLALSPAARRKVLNGMSEQQRKELRTHWQVWAHEGQVAPEGEWHAWLIMAGRGYGKTRAGAEWVREIARNPEARIALIAASLGEARRVMVEGRSGLLGISPRGRRPLYEPSRRLLTWSTGAQATLFSAGEPESLRGPQHSHAWCDEIAKWDPAGARAEQAWDNLLLGLRLGRQPQVVATTTPRAVPLIMRIIASDEATVTHGATYANKANLPPGFIRSVRREFGKSLLARQELDGELIEDIVGALWSRSLLERCREAAASDPPRRVVVAVDPPASAEGDACGIVVAALGEDGIGRVLADASVEKATPERWARAVAATAQAWNADRVVAEANQGGAMVEAVLRAASVALPLRLVHASRGKVARAEPVAALYESGRVRHAGLFPALEDQLCGLMTGGEYRGPGRSPDRADALVWALTELMLGVRGEPRVWAE